MSAAETKTIQTITLDDLAVMLEAEPHIASDLGDMVVIVVGEGDRRRVIVQGVLSGQCILCNALPVVSLGLAA